MGASKVECKLRWSYPNLPVPCHPISTLHQMSVPSSSIKMLLDRIDKGLGSLEADPMAVSEPVDFANIEPLALIAACNSVLRSSSKDERRHILQRASGYLRLGESAKAIAEIERSHKMGYPAATFALATAYFLGDDVLQDHVKAERLFLETYDKSVVWAARGLSSIYSDELSDLFDSVKAREWL